MNTSPLVFLARVGLREMLLEGATDDEREARRCARVQIEFWHVEQRAASTRACDNIPLGRSTKRTGSLSASRGLNKPHLRRL